MNNERVKIIAFYLPQFHPFKENDEWWGRGFTEWTNVAKAKPLFRGHYQPKIPADLGFYDLRLEETRIAQATMAKEAGIYGFCYWHYWFNGKELMERPFYEMVASGKPDFPFCIGWANESWMAKLWNKDGSISGGKTLIEQTYNEEDDVAHFYRLLPAFKDKRYILVDGAPLVFIHRAMNLPKHVMDNWNKLALENGFSGIHFVGRVVYEDYIENRELLVKNGYKAFTLPRLGDSLRYENSFQKVWRHLMSFFKRNGCPRVVSYERDSEFYVNEDIDKLPEIYPAIYPNWDHSPRSGKRGLMVINSTPKLFCKHMEKVLSIIKKKESNHKICFLKSWNEWGEGNYIEPDLKYGHQYLDVVRKIVDKMDV